MKTNKTKFIIIGAGLSGLVTAFQLQQKGEDDFLILEGRDRIGGRILTKSQIDFGATWFQEHHTHVIALLNALGIHKFNQFSKGKSVLVYNSMAPAHHFESDPDAPPAYRIEGGSMHLVRSLANKLGDKIRLGEQVYRISQNTNQLEVTTQLDTYYAEKVISTAPPRLSAAIEFNPALPQILLENMKRTHTWMSNAIKIGMSFSKPFWREKGFSGTIIGQVGPTIELYDHCDMKGQEYRLMGFVNEGLRDLDPELRKERILTYLESHLGAEIRDYLSYEEKDWSQDNYTSGDELRSVYISPSYGNPAFQTGYWNDSLYFSGAETSVVHGGYMDGAIYSALSLVERLMD